MTTEEYDKWLQDPRTHKVHGHNSIDLIDRANSILVLIFWSHQGVEKGQIGNRNRFLIEVSAEDKFHSIIAELRDQALEIDRYDYLMVNADEPNYATLFKIRLDRAKRQFELSLAIPSLLGFGLMTQEERTSIVKKY